MNTREPNKLLDFDTLVEVILSEKNDGKSMPKGEQIGTKSGLGGAGCFFYIGATKRSPKRRFPTLSLGAILFQKPTKIYEKIDAKIDTEKIMKIDEISMRKLSQVLILSEEGVREKTYFSEKANVRNTLAGCSRMRVGEGSPKKKDIEKCEKIK